VQFQAAGSAVGEGATSARVAIVLSTSEPALATDVAVLVSDSGLGSATSGSDFVPFPGARVVFPAGSVDGDSAALALDALADDRIEGAPETVRLALSQPTGGAGLGPRMTHKVEILDADRATVAFQSSSSATADEAQAPFPIAVALSLPPGVTLDATLSVRVSDAGTGTATKALDYVSFAAQFLALPSGSPSGTTFSVPLSVLADATVEGAESVVLALGSPSAGVELGLATSHTITITDDDLGPGAELGVVADLSGTVTWLPSGAMLDLGSQVLGAGPAGTTLVRLGCSGAAALSLELPIVTGADVRDFDLEFAPQLGGLGSAPTSVSVTSPLVARDGARSPGDVATLEPGLHAAARVGERMNWSAFGLRGESLELDLRRVRIPWSTDGRLVVDGAHIDVGETLGDLTLWSGRVAAEGDSSAFLALSSRGSRGWVRRRGTVIHFVSEREAPLTLRALTDAELTQLGASAPAEFCVEPAATPGRGAPRVVSQGSESVTSGPWPECRLALESDHQLYQRFGDAALLTQYVTALAGAASARFQVDVGTVLEIAYLGVHTQVDDGWSTPDTWGTTSQMLDEFQQRWGPAWGGSWPVSADLAHFLSGASLGGGIAYITVLCDQNWGFAVSANLNAAIDWSSWTGAAGPLNWDFVVFAHELGHNFGAHHTHAYCPPLDRCYSSCIVGTRCEFGTLMSYCHLCGGIANIDLRFHPFVANAMRAAVRTSCLGDVLLRPGESIDCLLRFDPANGVGTRRAGVSFEHSALNAPSPFVLDLVGNALP